MGDDLSADVAKALEPSLGVPVTVSELRPLTSGSSRQSWRFEAHGSGAASKAYVIQQSIPSAAIAVGDGPLSMETEARVLRTALAGGVRVAPVVAAGDWGDRQFMIAEWMDGEALPPKLLRAPQLVEGTRRLMADAAESLAAIHQLPIHHLGLDGEDRIDLYRARLDQIGEPRPVLELGYRWLRSHRPAPRPLSVIHGDFRLGNLLVGENGLEAVLDWELAHLGDPHEDVAWATLRAWRFDRYRAPGTFPETDPWAEAYSAAAGAGREIDPDSLRWWRIAGTWTWAVISAMQSRRHLDGWMQSLEHAVIGRRICESEWDLLELLP